MTYKITSAVKQKNKTLNAIQTIPSFTAIDLTGTSFSNSRLQKNIPVVLTYFSSACDFCQHEAKNIRENISSLENILLLFFSPEPIDKIEDFARKHELNQYSNVIFLHDENNKIAVQFGISTIPTSLIYNRESTLLKIHKGQIKPESILKELEANVLEL